MCRSLLLVYLLGAARYVAPYSRKAVAVRVFKRLTAPGFAAESAVTKGIRSHSVYGAARRQVPVQIRERGRVVPYVSVQVERLGIVQLRVGHWSWIGGPIRSQP